MSTEPTSTRQPRPGLWLVIIGGVVAVVFAILALTIASDSTAGPFWIVFGWGLLAFLFGLYRLIRGRSSLDHGRGGTDAGGR